MCLDRRRSSDWSPSLWRTLADVDLLPRCLRMLLRHVHFLLGQRLDVGLCLSRGRDMSWRLHDRLRVIRSLLNMLAVGWSLGLGGQRGGRPDWSP